MSKHSAADIKVSDHELKDISGYAWIPIAFAVRSVLDVEMDESGKFVLTEHHLATPYLKNYDAIRGNSPKEWSQLYDVSSWRMFIAEMNGRPVGGAIVTPAFREPSGDKAILFDIRVAPEFRGQGIGAALLHSASAWAKHTGSRWLEAETQNVNVPACRFYQKQGWELVDVERDAYPELPNEVRLCWRKSWS